MSGVWRRSEAPQNPFFPRRALQIRLRYPLMPDTDEVTDASVQLDEAPETSEAGKPSVAAAALIDPGWLFVVAGLAIMGATLLIPAADDLAHAQYLRDAARSVETHREQRLKAYEEYYDALKTQDRSLVMSLAASQLNQIPADRSPIPGISDGTPRALTNASVFPALEPPPLQLQPKRQVDSLLRRLATGETTRLWLIAGGAACVLIGVLPRAKTR